MEKTKNELPYYLKIEKNKDGVPVIYKKEQLDFATFAKGVLGLIMFAGLSYLFIQPENLGWIRLVFVVPFIAIAIILFLGPIILTFCSDTVIYLEPTAIIAKNRILGFSYTQNTTLETIDSIRTNQSLFAVKTNESPNFYLSAQMDDGNSRTLLGGFEKEIHAVYICDFINAYYGLDEKPKNQSSVTNN